MPRCETGKQLAYQSGKIHTCWLMSNASAYKANIITLYLVANSCRKFKKIMHSVATPSRKLKILKNILRFSNSSNA
jgi:hypothetical protein